MIMWTKQKPELLVMELLGLQDKLKNKITLEEALTTYSHAEGLDYPSAVQNWCKKILQSIDGRKLISTIQVKDAQRVFSAIIKDENEATANRARATIANAIRFTVSGEMPDKKPYVARPANAAAGEIPAEDVGKLKYYKAKLATIAHLVPLYSIKGRLGWFKAEVQTQVFSCEADEVAVIEAPKRQMTPKEADAMCKAAMTVLSKIKPVWTIRFNPNESVFIAMRQADFDALTKQQKGPN